MTDESDNTRGEGVSSRWILGTVSTPAGDVPRISTEPDAWDLLGMLRVRLGIRRMTYRVAPGLYAVGGATPESPVLVSANYKLSFDVLRKGVHGLDAWILVIDTKGINVWCAAGKGTFGTAEIVARAEATRLSDVVSHRRLVLPQLGAPGVAAHEVRKQSGFSVVYGPVRAKDLPAFIEAGNKASADMRRVHFGLRDRLAVVPVELLKTGKFAVIMAGALLLLARVLGGSWMYGGRAVVLVFLASLCGGVLVPVFLPWLPGSAFACKGAVLGVVLMVAACLGGLLPCKGAAAHLELLGWLFALPAIASFVGMNFTSATTFTSLSGVKREIRLFVPIQLAASFIGVGLWIAGMFVR